MQPRFGRFLLLVEMTQKVVAVGEIVKHIRISYQIHRSFLIK